MYERVEKTSGSRSRAVANTVTQKKSDGRQGFGFVDNRCETIVQRKLQEITELTTQEQSLGHEIIQKQRNRRKWTPQQREQSRKFWEKKRAKEERKERAFEGYKSGMQNDYGIAISIDDARLFSISGIPRIEISKAVDVGITPDDLSKLLNKGFSRGTIEGLAKRMWSLPNIKQWAGRSAPEGLLNEILNFESIGSWISNQHGADLNLGQTALGTTSADIGTKLGINVRGTPVAYSLTDEAFKSACIYESVKDALLSYSYLEPSIMILVRARKARNRTENAIQTGNQIFFKRSKFKQITATHELIHFHGNQDHFIKEFCFGKADGINEGITEYFTRKVTQPDRTRKREVYPGQVKAAEYLISKVGLDKVKAAYFSGEVSQLKVEYYKATGTQWTKEEYDRVEVYEGRV